MERRITPALAALAWAAVAASAPAMAQPPVDGRIVRVVYQLGPKATWGLHLAHMKDGRYCVRFGNPGRLTLAVIERVADICFDKVPGAVERTPERTSKAGDTSQQGKVITISTHHKGSIEISGSDITLKVATCTKPEYEADYRCFPNRYVVRMSGQDCSAEITLSRGKAGTTTCEHYAAQ